jgi:adenylylsulfate kinase
MTSRYRESHVRSVVKAVAWRIIGSTATAGIVYLFTGKASIALTVGAAEFVVKVGVFWLHERLWDRIRFGKYDEETGVIWLTGLSGAGKTALGQWLTSELTRRGYRVQHLDGDELRAQLELGDDPFSEAERRRHVIRTGHLASMLERQGVWVIASLISPNAEARAQARKFSRRFIEVHVATPLDECERRDPKGLYAKARRGEIRAFTGIDAPYDVPASPELRIDTTSITVPEAGAMVIRHVAGARWS